MKRKKSIPAKSTPKPKPRKPRVLDQAAIEKRRETQAVARRAQTHHGQNIGPIPPCKDPERRRAALADHMLFCETYLKSVFEMPWSHDHRRIIPQMDKIVTVGGKKALAMPRGSGKTALCLSLVLRASLAGLHPFAMYFGAVVSKGLESILWLKRMLSSNDLLLEDFPEVCYPIRMLGNEARKCLGQHCNGVQTNIKWSPNRIVLPTVAGSALSGFTIGSGSLDGDIRGGFITLPDGRMLRPSFAVVDDGQTDESARSQGPGSQTEKRLNTLTRAIQGLAGPNGRISILVPCTVIERGDLSDQILNRKAHPDFHGERSKRVYSWPTNQKLWETYREMREDAQRADETPSAATEFYRARMCQQGRRLDEQRPCAACPHQANCMDCGAVIDWIERMDNRADTPAEERNLSSLQAAMHSLYQYGPAGFASEFQNEPLRSETAARLPTAEEICAKANGYDKGMVPAKALHLTAFIDVGDDYLAYLVASWALDFSGWVLDYGTYPDQGPNFSKGSVKRSLLQLYPNMGKEAAVLAAVRDLSGQLLARQFPQEGGPPKQIDLCLVDTGYFPDAVHSAIKVVGRAANLRASRGRGITAGKTQFEDYKRDRCREMGLHWWVPKDSPQGVIQIDTNFFKTFIHSRIATAAGDPGALTLFGKPRQHELLAAHVLAEYYTTPSTEKGIAVQEWHQHPGRDNELFDCLVGSAVAAAKLGCSVIPLAARQVRRKRVSIDEMLARRQGVEVQHV